jgi:spore germination protein GerM
VRSRRAAPTAIGLVVTAVVVLAACGGGTQSQPEKLKRDAVPFGLLNAPTSTVAPTTVPVRKFPFVVYFMGTDGAVPVVRTTSAAPDPSAVGAALLAGPAREEVQVGMRSAIPKGAVGRFSKVVKHTVTIDLNAPFIEVSGPTQKLALTQIVFTMTSLEGVNLVRFLLDGEPISVPRLNGTLTLAPVRRADYAPRRGT